jgi:hypothetical protein
MPNPSTGIINKQYVSALSSFLDTREINRLITDIYNDDQLTDILNVGNKKMPTQQPFYNTFVDEELFKLVTVDSVSSGDGTVQVTFVATAGTSGYTRLNDLVMCTNGNTGIVNQISSASGVDTIRIFSVSGANLTVTAADQLALYSMAVGENSVSPQNLRYGLTRYFNKVQIFRETSKITDVQNASTVEVHFQGQNKWFFKDEYEKTVKLKGNINAAFWGGDMSTTSFSDTNPVMVDPVVFNAGNNVGGGGAIQTTRGVNKYIELYGTTLVDGTLGTYQKANLDNALDVLTSVRAPKNQLVVGSDKALRTVSTYYKNLGSSGVTSARLVINGQEMNLNVDQVAYGSYKLNYALMPILDQPTLFSQTDIVRSLYYMPMDGKVKVEGGGSDDQIRVRYFPRQSPYGNDMINEVYGGAYSPVNPNGANAAAIVDWVTTQGLEVLAAQHLLKQTVI